jgi:hypothetical protein
MRFEWDGSKAASNLKKHRVSFDEAVTVFYDPLAATFGDPDHSQDESRLITVGYSARVARPSAKGNVMKTKRPAQADDLRSEYNFDYSTAVRGKYYRRLIREGANVAVLEPDVARVFRSSAAVNKALRSLLRLSATTRRLTRPSGGRAANARR